jgi:hypothetical protein
LISACTRLPSSQVLRFPPSHLPIFLASTWRISLDLSPC